MKFMGAPIVGLALTLALTGSAGPQSRVVRGLPNAALVARVTHSYREAGTPGETFQAIGHPVLSRMSSHATAAAVVATRWPTADEYGQLVFFFEAGRFVGLNATAEAVQVRRVVARGDGRFAVTYSRYTPEDPLYDPTLAPVTILYQVGPRGVRASQPLPASVHDRMGVAVREQAASRPDIHDAIDRYREAGVEGETYQPLWNTLKTTPGSDNRVVTAIAALRWPSADGAGQILFFFDGSDFAGLNSRAEAFQIQKIVPAGPHTFRVTYANYAPTDAVADPTGPPVTITYRVTKSGVHASQPLPRSVTDGLKAVLKSGPPAFSEAREHKGIADGGRPVVRGAPRVTRKRSRTIAATDCDTPATIVATRR